MRNQRGRRAAWSTGWRAMRLHVAAFALAGGLTGIGAVFYNNSSLVLAPFWLLAGLCAGAVWGVAPAAVHGVAQGVLANAVPPDRASQVAPLLATVVSLTLGLIALVTVAVVVPDERAALAWCLAAVTAYVLVTWPLTRRVHARRR